tara:strand:- start:514 stop:864 length:351 start_codon:yes stop_codon:yes gene_type:complete
VAPDFWLLSLLSFFSFFISKREIVSFSRRRRRISGDVLVATTTLSISKREGNDRNCYESNNQSRFGSGSRRPPRHEGANIFSREWCSWWHPKIFFFLPSLNNVTSLCAKKNTRAHK